MQKQKWSWGVMPSGVTRNWAQAAAAIGAAGLLAVCPASGQSEAAMAAARGHAVVIDEIARDQGKPFVGSLSDSRHYAESLDEETLVNLLALTLDAKSRARSSLVIGPVLGKRLFEGDRRIVDLLLGGAVPQPALPPVLLIAAKGSGVLDQDDRDRLFEMGLSLMADEGGSEELHLAAMASTRMVLDSARRFDIDGTAQHRERAAALEQYIRNGTQAVNVRAMAVRELSLTPVDPSRALFHEVMNGDFPAPCRAAACSALAMLNSTDAMPGLVDILQFSDDSRLAATAALAIADLDTEEGLRSLVQSNRWMDEDGVRLAIEKSASRILAMLEEPAGDGWLDAVQATRMLYRNEDCRKAIAELLPRLSDAPSAEAREWICELVARRGTMADCEAALQMAGPRHGYSPAEESVWVRMETMRRFGEPASEE